MTILEEIFKSSKKDKLSNVNKSFFPKYLNSDIIIKLIDIRKLYLDILTFEKSKEEDIKTRDRLKGKLDNVLENKNQLENQNFSLLKKKIAIVKSLTEKIDIRKLEVEKEINDNIINNSNTINELTIEAESISNEINSLTINKYDKDMLVNALKYKLNNLDNVNINYISSDKKELYGKEISSVLINSDIMKCYQMYIFEMINSDIDNLIHIYNTAKNYMLITYQKDINMNLENSSIILEKIINSKLLESINKYIDIVMNNNLSNNRINEISMEKIKHNSIIHTMIHFAKNYKELYEDKEIINKEYEMIRGYVIDLVRETKSSNDNLVVNVINDTIDIFKSFSENIGD